jgi:hypothetical protein
MRWTKIENGNREARILHVSASSKSFILRIVPGHSPAFDSDTEIIAESFLNSTFGMKNCERKVAHFTDVYQASQIFRQI